MSAVVKVTVQDLTPEQVSARDLSPSDLVTLDFGDIADGNVEVAFLGTLDELIHVVAAAADQLAAIKTARTTEGGG